MCTTTHTNMCNNFVNIKCGTTVPRHFSRIARLSRYKSPKSQVCRQNGEHDTMSYNILLCVQLFGNYVNQF